MKSSNLSPTTPRATTAPAPQETNQAQANARRTDGLDALATSRTPIYARDITPKVTLQLHEVPEGAATIKKLACNSSITNISLADTRTLVILGVLINQMDPFPLLEHIESLDLSAIKFHIPGWSEQAQSFISKCPNLQKLLVGDIYTSLTIPPTPCLTHIETRNLFGSLTINQSPSLTHLSVGMIRLNCLLELTNTDNLESLSVDTITQPMQLIQLPKLKHLSITHIPETYTTPATNKPDAPKTQQAPYERPVYQEVPCTFIIPEGSVPNLQTLTIGDRESLTRIQGLKKLRNIIIKKK